MSDLPVVARDTTTLYQGLGPIPHLKNQQGLDDKYLGYPLLKWLDGIGQILGRITDLAMTDPDTGDIGWSIILDPDRCPTYALPWLAQLVGVRFDATQNTDAAQRAAIKAEQSWQRGTPAAIQAAAAKYLNPGQSVQIYERDTSPYHLTVVITLGQFTAGTYSQLSATYATYAAYAAAASTYALPLYPQALIEAAILSQKPAGLIMVIEALNGITYGTLGGRYETYAALDAAFATYNALTTTT